MHIILAIGGAALCEALVNAGGLPPLARLLSHPSAAIAELSALAFKTLASSNEGVCVAIAAAGAITPLVGLLGHPLAEVVDTSAWVSFRVLPCRRVCFVAWGAITAVGTIALLVGLPGRPLAEAFKAPRLPDSFDVVIK